MKYFNIITIGAATRDVYLKSRAIKIIRDHSFSTGEGECFALGSKIEIDELIFETGGGATNTAVGFARQGLRTAFIGKIGATDARGQEILRALKADKVSTDLVIRDKTRSTAYSVILLTARGERTVLVYRGASADFKIKDFKWSTIKGQWLYVTSLGGQLGILKIIWRHAAINGLKIAWNPGQGELDRGYQALLPFIRQTDVMLLNQEEAAQLFNLTHEQDEVAFDQLRQVVKGIMVVTKGTDGAMAGNANVSWHSSTHHVDVVDTTGCGDAFGCGFVGTIIRTKGNIPAALKFATANSESVIRHIGAKNGLLKGKKLVDPVAVTRR